MNFDIIVVGGGPAGLTASLYALRAGKSVAVIEKNTFGGQMTFSPKIENYPGFPDISGNELAEKFIDQLLTHGVEVFMEEVVSVKDENGKKCVTTQEGNSYRSKAVIIATGAKHRLLGVPNEERYIGNGISFCAVCDGAFYDGQKIAVIGGGNSALQEANMLADICKSVTVIQNLSGFTGEEKLVEALYKKDNVNVIFNATVKEFFGGDTLEGIVISVGGQEQRLTFDGVFTAIGLVPENEIITGLAALDRFGYAQADESCTTGCPGLFVAGDCRTKKTRQITTAAADGAVAGLAACAYIDASDAG